MNRERELTAKIAKITENLEPIMDDVMKLCDQVRDIAYAIHVYHGNGYLEKVYENALVHRLGKAGYNVRQQQAINIYDEDGTTIGEYFADIIVNDMLILELKATKALTDEHTAQILHYLKATRSEHGMLINFGSYRFEVRKFARSLNPAPKENQP